MTSPGVYFHKYPVYQGGVLTFVGMEHIEKKPGVTEEEQVQLDALERAADAARQAGVYNPSETEEKN